MNLELVKVYDAIPHHRNNPRLLAQVDDLGWREVKVLGWSGGAGKVRGVKVAQLCVHTSATHPIPPANVVMVVRVSNNREAHDLVGVRPVTRRHNPGIVSRRVWQAVEAHDPSVGTASEDHALVAARGEAVNGCLTRRGGLPAVAVERGREGTRVAVVKLEVTIAVANDEGEVGEHEYVPWLAR